eukprot:418981_1
MATFSGCMVLLHLVISHTHADYIIYDNVDNPYATVLVADHCEKDKMTSWEIDCTSEVFIQYDNENCAGAGAAESIDNNCINEYAPYYADIGWTAAADRAQSNPVHITERWAMGVCVRCEYALDCFGGSYAEAQCSGESITITYYADDPSISCNGQDAGTTIIDVWTNGYEPYKPGSITWGFVNEIHCSAQQLIINDKPSGHNDWTSETYVKVAFGAVIITVILLCVIMLSFWRYKSKKRVRKQNNENNDEKL